jgi:NitT/TauT family transport system substrate-binding protein
LARQQGWQPGDIRSVGLGAVTSMIAALKTSQVDSIFADLSVVYRLETAGEARRIVNFGDVVPDFYAQVIFAGRSFVDKNPDALRRFLGAWFETIAFMRRDKATTVAVSKETMGVPTDGAAAIYDELMPSFSTDGKFDPKAAQALKRSFVELQLLPAEPDMATLYTEKFLPRNRSD